ncbi:hypothetical protein QSV37_12235 [Acinetobacter sp. VNK23]|uniref:hypothetical protein n=1 Tax=Acinetobacter thutiue TaxID=2998078 RepID=UPI0025776237|nr:hypothetical protein [Acinetobacter thutiue]MDM1021063.1 hypothetical protein [Acinetobacter thutiue]
MKNNFKLNIGDRFTYLNENYEICYIENEVIRYSNFISGSMHFITEYNLVNKILNGDIKLTTLNIQKTHKNQKLTIDEISKYLTYIFSNKIPCTNKKLKSAILKLRKDNPNVREISASTLARYSKTVINTIQ